MTNFLLLLSTCGTSTLTNGAPPDTVRWLVEIANRTTLAAPEQLRLDALVAECAAHLAEAGEAECCRRSAEYNGAAAARLRWPAARTQHLLVHTDTAVGRAASSIVRCLLARHGDPVEPLTVAGLRTDDHVSFRNALCDLTAEIEAWLPANRAGKTVFNLTGGFKSINAYLQALGMLVADHCVFLFETSEVLIEIPRLPVRLTDGDELRVHIEVFRRLAQRYPVSEAEAAGVPETLLLADDGQVTTSVWGDAVWGRHRKQLLADQLYPPLSPKIDLSDDVQRMFQTLEQDRRLQVNEAIDRLSAHFDLGHQLPSSNTFKKLKGNPSPPSTHELYLWSDGAAWRLYGHYTGDRFVADSIGPHL